MVWNGVKLAHSGQALGERSEHGFGQKGRERTADKKDFESRIRRKPMIARRDIQGHNSYNWRIRNADYRKKSQHVRGGGKEEEKNGGEKEEKGEGI